jgi:hypothetical protein
VQFPRRGIPWLAGVTEEHLPPASAENQCGTEASWATTNDYDVVHASVGLQEVNRVC